MGSKEGKKLTKLAKRVKDKLNIQYDEDVGGWDHVKNGFQEHFCPQSITQFIDEGRNKKNKPVCLHTDLVCDGLAIICGFDDGACSVFKFEQLHADCGNIVIDRKKERFHSGLSCIRCSHASPSLFFTSSSSDGDGIIRAWDTREPKDKPCQAFCAENNSGNGSTSSKRPQQKKPILNFDVSCNDQIICGGTERVGDDSYLLFWDIRNSKLLGAYWESHSDDVTAIKFSSHQVHSLASGSTDGLLNVFNLLEPMEDYSLQYSFNSNSSIDSIVWHCSAEKKPGKDPTISCITHTNEFQIWDPISGDRVAEFKREAIAEAMMRRNSEAVYVTSCHNLGDSVGLLTCPIVGGAARLLEYNQNTKLVPRGLFIDQTTVIQTAQPLDEWQRWITFDENGLVKVWNSVEQKSNSKEMLREEKRNNKGRCKPYRRD